jgi:hypothetical protein
VELARRLRASNADDPEMGEPLAGLCEEIEDDREALQRVMAGLGVGRSHLKPKLAWAGEKLGRLKLNGTLREYSPLSRLLEIELLALGVTGKLRLWSALRERFGESAGGEDLAVLRQRAASQRERLEVLHGIAATRAFAA